MGRVHFVASGPSRGECLHRHKTAEDAGRCAAKDRAECEALGGGAYSDRWPHASDCQQVSEFNAPCTCAYGRGWSAGA